MVKKYGFAVLFLLLLGVYFVFNGLKAESNDTPLFEPPPFQSSTTPSKSYIYVDVRGAVMVPGVYRMESEDRIFSVIERAGGFHPEAVKSSVNQAAFLNDGDTVDVLFEGEIPTSSQSGKISLNQASQSELESLSGIGPQTALSIIAYRNETPFRSIEDLMNVSGIGEVTYQAIKDFIVP